MKADTPTHNAHTQQHTAKLVSLFRRTTSGNRYLVHDEKENIQGSNNLREEKELCFYLMLLNDI